MGKENWLRGEKEVVIWTDERGEGARENTPQSSFQSSLFCVVFLLSFCFLSFFLLVVSSAGLVSRFPLVCFFCSPPRAVFLCFLF